MRLHISRVKNIDSVFELYVVAFRLARLYDGLFVQILQSLHIHFWFMAFFSFDLIEAALTEASTLGQMPPKYI